MIFWIAAIGLLLLAVLILVLSIIRAKPVEESDDRQQQNIDIAKDKKIALDLQLAQAELNQEEYDNALLDLQTALALDLENSESTHLQQKGKWVVWPLVVIIPLMSFGLYFQLGEYRVIEDPSIALVASTNTQNQHSNLSIDEILELLKQRLIENPEDAEGWYMLGRTLMSQRKFDEAITAYRRTYDLVGEDPGVIFSLADALAMKSNGVMQGEPAQLIKRGLEISPQNPTGLWLSGMVAEQRQDYKSAHDAWTRLLPLVQNNPASVAEVQKMIQRLEQRDPQLAALAPAQTVSAPSGKVLNLSVKLSADLQELAGPEDFVFVYAKAMEGPPMPLAVKRMKVKDLPVDVTLSNDDAMVPTMKLSNFAQVIVGARITKSGNPVAQSGDLFIEVEGVNSKNPPANMVLLIDQIK